MTVDGMQVETTFLEVVERLAFMFGDPCSAEDVAETDGTWLSASIPFRGTVTDGTISLAIPEALCAEIAANILGLDTEDISSDFVSRDSFKEMLNVVAGHIVPELQGEHGGFDLGVPELNELAAETVWRAADWEQATCFDLDGSPVVLTLELGERSG